MLEARDVTVRFDGRTVIDRMSVTLADGEIVAMQGPSGSGKSTLLRVIAGLLVPDAGVILLDGTDITSLATHRRDIGMVFQDNQLFPHRTVGQNVEFGLRIRGVSPVLRRERVAEVLALVGLGDFEHRSVGRLSGGEAKRVALARSLAPRPKVLLLDEPLTGLDRDLHDQLAVEVAAVLRGTETTALLVTHDRDEAATIATRTVHLATT